MWLFNSVMRAKTLDVVDWPYSKQRCCGLPVHRCYWQQKDYCVWQQKTGKKNQLAYKGSMYENWQWGLWKRIRAVRLFGLNFISGDTADVASQAQHPNRERNNLPYGKPNFKNNRTIQNRYQLRQQTFYYSSSSFYSFWLMAGNFGESFAQKNETSTNHPQKHSF